MKVITIVGIRQSGKTSTVTALIQAIRRRGQSVGTCKTVFCPTFSIDKAGSNTHRHRQAGAQLIGVRAKGETSLIYPEALPLGQVLEPFRGMDWVLLEGDYLSAVPRLVAAHNAEDALMRMNDLTLAFVGRISQKEEISLPLPRFNALENADSLLDYLAAHVADITPDMVPVQPLPPVPGVTDDGFCQCGCHHHQKSQAAKNSQAMVDGRQVKLTPQRLAMLREWAAQDERQP